MSRAAISISVLIATIAIFGALVVAVPRQAEALDDQPSYGGSTEEAQDRDTAATDSVVSGNWTAVSGNATAVRGNGTTVGGNAVATGCNVTAIGGNATASSYAVGGNAIVISSAGDFVLHFNNTSGDDFWSLLRSTLSQLATDGAAVLTGDKATAGGQAVGGSAVAIAGKGARAVGGSAVFVGGKGGRAVGGSATVLGIVGGRLRVLRHANGETSNVSKRVASGGVVTVP